MIQHQQQLSLVLHWYLTLTTTAVPVPVLLTPAKGDQSVLVFRLNYYKILQLNIRRFLQCNNHNLCCWRRQLFQFFWHRQGGPLVSCCLPVYKQKLNRLSLVRSSFPTKATMFLASKENPRRMIETLFNLTKVKTQWCYLTSVCWYKIFEKMNNSRGWPCFLAFSLKRPLYLDHTCGGFQSFQRTGRASVEISCSNGPTRTQFKFMADWHKWAHLWL